MPRVSLDERAHRLQTDRRSGASELVRKAVALLSEAHSLGPQVLARTAHQICCAQPCMASLWNAAAAALDPKMDRRALDEFEERLRRAPRALCRVAVGLLAEKPAGSARLHLATLSFSGSVLEALTAVARACPTTVACAEGRPALEGRRLARRLAAADVAVEFYTDAGIGAALETTSAVVVGADAVAPEWFINKCGTLPLAAAASRRGVPVYVVASRDKFVPEIMAGRLQIHEQAGAELWRTPPRGVTVRNVCFERIPLDLVAGIITDIGFVGAASVGDVCRAQGKRFTDATVKTLTTPGVPAVRAAAFSHTRSTRPRR